MCNLYTLDGQLNVWADAFQEFLGLRLALPAGVAEGTSNLTYASAMYPKYQGLFVRAIDASDPEAGLEPAVGRWSWRPSFTKGRPRLGSSRPTTAGLRRWQEKRASAMRSSPLPTGC